MADTIKKAKLAAEDIHFDAAGTGSTISILKSDGNFRSGSRINAGHIPSKTATRAKTRIGSGTPATTQTDTDGHIAELYDDLAKIGEPDDSTVEVNAGILRVKDAGITAAKLKQTSGSEAVVTDAIRDDNVTNAKMAANAVAGSASGASGDNCIEAASIDTADLAADCINNSKVEDNAIQKENLADNSVGINELDMDGNGTAPAFFVFAGGQHPFGGGGTTTSISVTGLESTDRVVVTLTAATTLAYFKAVVNAGPDTIDITFNVDPGASTTLDYMVYRATA